MRKTISLSIFVAVPIRLPAMFGQIGRDGGQDLRIVQDHTRVVVGSIELAP